MTTSPIVTITDELLAEIEASADAATPGPWEAIGAHVFTVRGAKNRAGSVAHESDGWNIATVNPWATTNADGEDEDLPVTEHMSNHAYIALANPATIKALLAHIADLKQQLVAAGVTAENCELFRKDAERYRWLRNPDQDVCLVLDKMVSSGVYEYRAGEELDAAIDAAMEADQ